MILNALNGKSLPIYGDWLFVEDHCAALREVLGRERPGDGYNIGGRCEKADLEVIQTLCRLMDGMCRYSPWVPHSGLISFVKDQAGDSRR
jgi:dTDP-glucose 4,6-dehydratase